MYNTKDLVAIACSAYRHNDGYRKVQAWIHNDDDTSYLARSNRELMTLFLENPNNSEMKLTEDDKQKADDILKYFNRLMFSVLKNDNDFQSKVFSLLKKEESTKKDIGMLAYIPMMFQKDQERRSVKSCIKECLDESLGEEKEKITNKKCLVIETRYIRNYDIWSVTGIIENKIVSWISQDEIELKEIIIERARVKGITKNWHSSKTETRLNYVKIIHNGA